MKSAFWSVLKWNLACFEILMNNHRLIKWRNCFIAELHMSLLDGAQNHDQYTWHVEIVNGYQSANGIGRFYKMSIFCYKHLLKPRYQMVNKKTIALSTKTADCTRSGSYDFVTVFFSSSSSVSSSSTDKSEPFSSAFFVDCTSSGLTFDRAVFASLSMSSAWILLFGSSSYIS